MEEFVAIAIIIIGIIGSMSKSKKVIKNRPGQGNQPPAQPDFKPTVKKAAAPAPARTEAPAERTVYRPKPAQNTAVPKPAPVQPTAPATPDRAGQRPLPSLQELLQSFLGEEDQPASPKPAAVIPESQSAMDAKGCVGGSLPHDASALHEGDTVKKMPPRVEFRHPDTSADFEPQHDTLRVSAEDMRRAVVMAEILGKPKALRPRSERP